MINIQGTNLELTASVKGYLDERLDGVRKFVDIDSDAATAQVELEETKEVGERAFRAEITISGVAGNIRAEEFGGTIEVAIDALKDTVMRELRDKKEKHDSSERDGARAAKDMLQGN